MNKIFGLPKNAIVAGIGLGLMLEIKNNRIQGEHSFTEWLMQVFWQEAWEIALPLMKQQGFKFKGVIEECISDIKDPEKFPGIFYWFEGYEDVNEDYLGKIIKSEIGKQIKDKTIEKLSDCTNWDDLAVLQKNSDFMKSNNKKIKAEMVRMRNNDE